MHVRVEEARATGGRRAGASSASDSASSSGAGGGSASMGVEIEVEVAAGRPPPTAPQISQIVSSALQLAQTQARRELAGRVSVVGGVGASGRAATVSFP